jgi:hypothetical protein
MCDAAGIQETPPGHVRVGDVPPHCPVQDSMRGGVRIVQRMQYTFGSASPQGRPCQLRLGTITSAAPTSSVQGTRSTVKRLSVLTRARSVYGDGAQSVPLVRSASAHDCRWFAGAYWGENDPARGSCSRAHMRVCVVCHGSPAYLRVTSHPASRQACFRGQAIRNAAGATADAELDMVGRAILPSPIG